MTMEGIRDIRERCMGSC